MAKLNDGAKFDEVARNYSEDKARVGTWKQPIFLFFFHFLRAVGNGADRDISYF